MAGRETTICFVENGNFEGKFLRQAFENSKSKELDVELVSAKELLEKGVDEGNGVFVVDEFTGDVFELLLAHKKRIFGPICILQCLENEVPLPNAIHPVYCLAMTGVIVSCTNVAKNVREKLKSLIERMNGVFAKDFTSEVTHLVAGEVGSAKYAIAANLKKPIVLPSWVDKAWQQVQTEFQFDATDEKFVDNHRCPILKGCSICVSGLNGRRKEEIKRLVEKHGGVYSAELQLKVTTHLLIENPTGQKYQFALRWSVHCVKPDWLHDCINAGCWIEETPYLVKGDKDPNSTRMSNVTLSTTTVDATMNGVASDNKVSRKAAQAAKESAKSYGNKELLNDTRQSSFTRLQTSGFRKLNKSKHRNENVVCNYNVQIPSDGQFLDGCCLYLTGFNEAQLEYLQKIINAGGATRFNQMNPSVSHVVVGDKSIQDIEKLINSESSPHVVTVQWLLESCKQVKCMPEQDYYCFESNEVVEEHEKLNKENNEKEKKVPVSEKINENDDILKQYLDMMHNNNKLPSTSKDLTTEKESDANGDGRYSNKDDTTNGKLPSNEKIEKHDLGESKRHNNDQGIFSSLKFRLDGFTEEQEAELTDDIESHGGSVLSNESKIIANYLIVPLNFNSEENRVKEVVTYCWLERCLESKEILLPNSEFVFTPFSQPDDVLPLQDCVISISQYAELKREHLAHLIEILGGHFQEYFSRATRSNVLSNTHLILEEPLGSKYEASINWNIPALKAEWLYECARRAARVPEAPYLLRAEKSPEVEMEQTGMDMDKSGEGNDKQGELGAKTSSLFNEFTVPQSKGGNRKTGDKSEESLNNDKTKDKEVASSSNKQPISMKVPPCFGKPQRPSFDLTDALECLQSPCVSSGSSSAHSRLSRGSRNSFLMDDYIHEQLQAALKNTGNLLESRQDDPEDSTVDKERSADEREGYSVDKESSDVNKEGSTVDMEDPPEEKDNASGDFLRDVVITVSKKCAKKLSDIYSMATSVGVEYKDSLDKTCTHLIHEGRLTKEQTKVKSKGVHIVSPHWLYDCIEQQCHLDESLYPSGYNPKLTLSVVKTRRSTRSTKDISDDTNDDESKDNLKNPDNTSSDVPQDTEKDPKEEEDDASPSKTAIDECTKEFPMDDLKQSELEAIAGMSSQSSVQSDSLRTREEIKQIQHIMESIDAKTSRRRSSRFHNSGNSGHSRNSSESNELKNPRRSSSRLRSLRSSKDNSEENDDEDQNAAGEITYDDPKSRHERQKIIAQLEDYSPSVKKQPDLKNIPGEQVNKSKGETNYSYQGLKIKKESISPPRTSTPTLAAPPIALQITSKSNLPEPVSLLDPEEDIVQEEIKPRRLDFILSTMSQQEKIDYGALIESLGGTVFDSQFFNPSSRHTIAGQLNRNEKCLSSIAAGNWLLRKSYLEECRKAGHFVDEEPHEWGLSIPGESLTSLAKASRRWRIELTGKSARFKKKFGAFQDWKVLLCVEENKAGSFSRLLEAGGAKVMGTSPPYQNIAHVTHAFISPGASCVNNIDFNRLQQAGILVLRTDYIVEFLTAGDNTPDTSIYLYRPSNLASRKRKQHDSSLPETPGKKKREN